MARPRSKPSEWADSAETIKASRTMDVTLLSGAKVTLRTVTLDELALDDAIPGDLIEVAILDSADLLLPQMLDHVRAQRPEEAQRLSKNAVLLDWHGYAGGHPEFFYDDGIHLRPDGAAAYARFVAGSLGAGSP